MDSAWKEILADERARGREEGREEGRQEGLAEGRQKGLAEGRQEEKIENARTMKSLNIPSEVIHQVTGLPIKDIEEL